MFEQHGFYFGGGGGESFVFDHLFTAVEDVVEAVGIAADYVSGEIPAIAKHGGGGLRLLPVSHHDLRSAHHEFTLFAGRYLIPFQIDDAAFCEGQRLSDRSGAAHLGWSDVAGMGDR